MDERVNGQVKEIYFFIINKMAFPRLKPFAIIITTYEYDKEYTPILSHVFWGNTYDEALGYAKAHLKTDVFFSSSFIGELQWGDSVLILSNDGQYLGTKQVPAINEALEELAEKARDVYEQQMDLGMVQTVQALV